MSNVKALDPVKTSVHIHMNDVNFEYLIEHALSCILERVDKDVAYVNGLKFGTIECQYSYGSRQQVESSAEARSTGRAVHRRVERRVSGSSRMVRTSQ